MAYEVQMPKWGLTMKTGKIARWLVSEGGAVETGQPLLEVETDKITNVVESPASGVLLQIVSPQGEVVPVMQVIGVIGAAGEAVAAQPSASAAATSAAPAKTEKAPASAAAKASGEPVRAMPAARRLAAELGVDLASVQGSGRDGAVTEKDVRAAHEAAQKAPAAGGAAPAASGSCTGSASSGPCCEDEIVPMDGLRKLIADNMMASLQGAAQLTVFVEADVTEMVALRDSMLARNKKNPDYRLSYNDIIAFAVCRALLRHPVMNSTLREDGIHLHKHVNLGMAVSLDTGLIVPNVKNADTFSLEQLKEKVRDAASRARKGGLSMDEISGGTFTISNVSMLGVDGFTPILNPPETGILGVGRVVEKPGVFEGEVCVRKMMTLSLTFNHMVTDGGPAMSFLRTLADMLEKPVRMLG
ncbi:dihydrolipoamide acetyltransferase family protein [Desulfovibrio sp. 86]|uniref:Dihydrolipoamide acetyltransferase component of pyruvate dehydrogenase complex n=1 Tax=uncultured Desulfovibrio sp. TaxID=167968 RepID=A0A212LA19_9BACT|nr:dihydrolipoamide acetyltransferase family protein [Desulfovibrio sp. 86]SCM74337.1 Catalytic domain-containing protein [uncultured Desulfovibrio sp.]VZH34772.1 Dihydrolipoamide acetyltransferase component of pyruvate dehydrogenase complex [Desulfovibrio sp. 86]